METSLHQQLKSHYATSPDQIEVAVGGYRIDVVRDHELIEIQCASLSAIRKKIIDLLQRHDVRIVKPSVHRTRICKRDVKGGPIVSNRLSPKCGQVHELFEELIYLRGVFPHPRLTLEIPIVDVNQVRWMRKKKSRRRRDPGFVIEDTQLVEVRSTIELTDAADLWRLLPLDSAAVVPAGKNEFNTQDLADAVGCPRWIAQRIAYVLHHCQAIAPSHRNKIGVHYQVA